ncbi:sodium/sugar symporter [Chondrinema litorale]|uniref:sodium/sugar symporter n=1 Tax=Chondrinema litorale TaxID=2994555 RepID=UPI002542A106|nr:sodium/sugar symporter [Chondrinema litorale]UZR93236.1 sodium/sugar symporter [Chondrinema litorale]
MNFSTIDVLVFIGYCLVIIGLGLWVSKDKKGHTKDSKDYFLASKSLPWWAIGASLIASNISAEQFIGMSGSGFAMGLAISTYEWMAAATLIIVGKFFLPIFLKKEIYTMPQFLQQRYNDTVRTMMAVFWLLVYVFVNLTSVLYLGALSLETVMGIPLQYAIIGLAVFAIVYSIYGGLTAVAWTDVVQVVFLVAGGLATTYLALDIVGEGDAFAGLGLLRKEAADHFSMILSQGEMMIPDGKGGVRDAYLDLPGLSVLVGGMWIVNLNYWGCNQYITQRALAAKNLDEAQRGVLFAGFLKLLIPLIVVIPGIAAYIIVQNPDMLQLTMDRIGVDFQAALTDEATGLIKSDKAYPALLNLLPTGLKGVAFAALAAAIVSSLASMANSTSTIFTMDLYKNYFNKNASEANLVRTGRIVSLVAFFIAALVAPQLGVLDQAFQFIQEYTGFVSPGVLAIFVFGFFWKRTTAAAAFAAAILTIPLSVLFKFATPDLPFIDRMGIVFLIIAVIMIIISLMSKEKEHPNAIELSSGLFKTSPKFNIGALLICGILAALYAIFW